MDISIEDFEKLVANAIDAIPEKYAAVHENVVFDVDEVPSFTKRRELKLRAHEGLYGLFEGVPDTGRRSGASGILPAKITIYRHPMIDVYHDIESLQKQVTQTVWHEVAHYFGLGHEAMHRIQRPK